MPGDLRWSDVALGLLAAAAALGSSGAAVLSSATTAFAESTSILAPGEIAVTVNPVAPSELTVSTTSHGADAGSPWPSASAAPDAPERPPGLGMVAAPVPPRPSDAPPPMPPEALPERPEGGIKRLPRLSSPTAPRLPGLDVGEGERGFGPGGPTVAPGTADAARSPNDPYAYVDPAREDPSAPAGSGVVADEGDPLADRAVAAYRQRLQRWLSTHFYVTDSGLSERTLRSARAQATIDFDEDRRLVSWSIVPGGHPVLDAAARRALQAMEGEQAPAPAGHYPGPLQRRVSVTFVCTEAICN